MYQWVQCVKCGRPRDRALSGTDRCFQCGSDASLPIPASETEIPAILSSILTLAQHLVTVRPSAAVADLCAAIAKVSREHDETDPLSAI